MEEKNLLPVLEISCTSSDCDNDLHCFHNHTKKNKMANPEGDCVSCHKKLVDWDRVRQRDLTDIQNTFESLKVEYWRHYWWHVEIDQRAINYGLRKGLINLKIAARKRIKTAVGPEKPAYDGRQTPKEGNILYYAQHATATCCRKCIEQWHGVNKERALTDAEMDYFTELLMLFVAEKMPDLQDHGQKVPPIRVKK